MWLDQRVKGRRLVEADAEKEVEVAGVGGGGCTRRGRRAAEQSANLRVFGSWKTWWRTRFRAHVLPRTVGDESGMWNKRLVRLALLQHLRAVYGLKVKGGRGQCNRKRKETAATETVVSSGEYLG